MLDWNIAFAGLVPIGVLAFATWIASVVQRDVSLVDRAWGVLIASAAVVYFVLLAGRSPAASTARGMCMLALVCLWALRLSAYITWRNWGHGEDRRYQQIRARNEPHFAIKSLYLVFALQALLAWAVSAPFFAGMSSAAPIAVLDVIGIALAAFGIVFEAIGDAQMSRFKADPANKGRVMDHGVWRYTRHPNYFGETCIWWGFWAMALGAGGPGAVWTIVSPVIMTVLLLKVSGVSLLEKDISERRPAYRDYIARTNAFFPGPPRSGSSR